MTGRLGIEPVFSRPPPYAQINFLVRRPFYHIMVKNDFYKRMEWNEPNFVYSAGH